MKIITCTDPERFLDLDAPTVAAHPCSCPETVRLLWRIDCPICGAAHYHGPGEGHRIGHCQPVTAESIRGYNPGLPRLIHIPDDDAKRLRDQVALRSSISPISPSRPKAYHGLRTPKGGHIGGNSILGKSLRRCSAN